MSNGEAILPTHERLKFLRSRLACKKPRRTTLFVVPWINIALLLFAFHFVHSQRVLSPGIALSLPTAPFTGGAPVGSDVVTVLRGGSIFFHDERVSAENLPTALKHTPAASGPRTLLIEADGAVTHDQLAVVYNAAQAAGYGDVILSTRLPDTDANGDARGR